MTDTETERLCTLLMDQTNLDVEAIGKAIGFWKANLLHIDYVKAQESIKAILFEKRNIRRAGEWFASIVKYCGGVQAATPKGTPIVVEGCERCKFSGCIEVPHHKNWHNGQWIGMYTMVVACECSAGALRASQMMRIGQYEHLFPYWKNEYPMRQYEFQLRTIEGREPPKDKLSTDLQKTTVAWLKKQLADQWEVS